MGWSYGLILRSAAATVRPSVTECRQDLSWHGRAHTGVDSHVDAQFVMSHDDRVLFSAVAPPAFVTACRFVTERRASK